MKRSSNLHDGNRARRRWFDAGVSLGLISGMLVTVVVFSWAVFLTDERTIAAAIIGVSIGAGGCWAIAVYDRDLFRDRRELKGARKQVAYLTRVLEAHEDWDD